MKRIVLILCPLLCATLAGCKPPADGSTAGSLKGTLTSTPSPPVVGHDNTFSVTLKDGGAPVTGAQVNLAFFYKGLNQNGPTATPQESAPGVYTAREISTGMNGQWEVTVTVTRPGKPEAKLTLPFSVAKGAGTGD